APVQRLVRARVPERTALEAGALEAAGGFTDWPVPDDVTPERDHVPRLDLRGPIGYLTWVLVHEPLDPSLIRLDHPAHLRADLAVPGLADLGVPHDSLAEVVLKRDRAENLGHRAPRAAIVLEQLFQTVFGLGIARGVGGVFERGGENVRNPEFVAINRRGLIGRTSGRGLQLDPSDEHQGNQQNAGSFHRCWP